MSPEIKQHIIDMVKAVLAAALIAALQAALQVLSGFHIGALGNAAQVAAAFSAIKMHRA